MTTRSERGAALLISILAVAVLGAGLMAVLALSGNERRSIMNQVAQTDAYAVAQTGLAQYVANRAALGFSASPAAAYESTRVTVSDGYADVVLTRLRPAVGTASALYVIRSHGYASDPRLSGTPTAERQVAQLAQWNGGTMQTMSAWTSLTGLTKNGGSGTISGVDACAAASSVAGVAVATPPGYSQNGGSSVPAGSPNIQSLGTAAQAAATIKIDWAGITAGTSLTPTISMPGGTWPASFPAGYYPVIFVTGDYTLPGNGQGTLIVTGSLTISGANTWHGVILAGNTLTSNGNSTVSGAVVTGLNVLLGQSPAASAVGNGTKTFQYNSCDVASAMAAFGGLQLIPNAWADNWAGY